MAAWLLDSAIVLL